MSSVEIRHLTKVFEHNGVKFEALKDINLSITRGDIHGIIGMSGAGKSTLVRCLNYLERPTEGEVIIDGKDMGGLSEKELRARRAGIGMIFQNFNLLMQRNVLENVCFPLRISGMEKKEAKTKAMDLLQVVGIAEKAGAYPATLSGGQKQRVAIARALATDPGLLLCDEATSALDPQTTAAILKLLKDINQKMGITIIIITHQMSVIQEVCKHVAIIENGVLVENGTVEDIFTHPKSRAARELIMKDKTHYAGTGVGILRESRRIRIVFSENSSFEPVIANMVLRFQTPVNILLADTKNVGGVAKGEMILGLPSDRKLQVDMEDYLRERGLEIEEVPCDVE